MFPSQLSDCKTTADTCHFYAVQSRIDGNLDLANWWADMADAYERGQGHWWSSIGGDSKNATYDPYSGWAPRQKGGLG